MNTRAHLQTVKIIVFDLDDTLYSEYQYVQSGFKTVSAFLHTRGLVNQNVFPTMWDRFIAGKRTALFDRVLEEYGIEPKKELIDELVQVYREHNPEITLYQDALNVLTYFYGRKPLALLSDGYLQTQTAKLAALGIEHYFEAIVLTDQLGRDCWKPSTAGFKNIMQSLGGEPAGYVYIGDNPTKDFAAPRRLGWHTVCVKRTQGVYTEKKAPNKDFEADFQVDSLYQAARLLDPDFTAP